MMIKTFCCKNCGIAKQVSHRNTNQYCSVKCQKQYAFLKRFDAWLAGKIETSHIWLRKALAKKFGNFCAICKISNWQNKPIVLEVEHKDGNSENNAIDNLCLICPNCHSQTPTYKGANLGKGRHIRRQRYAEGKSY